MIDTTGDYYIPDNDLARVFTDPRTLKAFQAALSVVQQTPQAVEDAQGTADQAAIDAAAAQAAASGAQTDVDLIKAASLVVFSAAAVLTNERVLTGSTGVTIDTATAGQIKVLVDALAILNGAAISLTQPVDVQGSLRCDSLRVDVATTATGTLSTHSIPINCNGTTYYMRLSNVP
jgi:hypothetical protein